MVAVLAMKGAVMMCSYVINTIAFKDKLKKGISQADIIEESKKMGFDVIEVRSEFLNGRPEELERIKKVSERKNIGVFYSVNDVLYKNGQLNSKLPHYVKQMHQMGASNIKLNLGKCGYLNSAGLVRLLDGTFSLKIENNQTLAESDLVATQRFFRLIEGAAIPHISYCFDIANWSWLSATANEAAVALANVTDYVHLKNEMLIDRRRQVTDSLEKGDLDWRSLIKLLPMARYLGFEYASTPEVIAEDLEQVKSFLSSK